MQAEFHSVVDAIARRAEGAPEAPAYVDDFGSISYGALHSTIVRGSGWLAQQGVRPGDTVALAPEPGLAGARRGLGLLYAVGRLGAAVLPLLPDTPAELRAALLKQAGARWLLAPSAPAQMANVPLLNPEWFDPRDEALERHAPPRGDEADRAFIHFFTSGSTGISKNMLLTHVQIAGKSVFAARSTGATEQDRLLPAAPWPMAVGVRYLLRAHAIGAAFVRAHVSQSRRELAGTLERHGVTQLTVAPVQLRALIREEPGAALLPPLRYLGIAGAAVSREDLDLARTRLSPNLAIDYGSSETGPIAQMRGADLDKWEAGCVGKLLSGVEARVDDAAGHALAPGETGELGLRAPWMPTGYVGDAEATHRFFRDGWFYPGDTGRIDAAGRVHLVGRTRDIINSGGLKIAPEEIESVIRRHPLVVDVAVVGLPHALAGQVAAAFIVLRTAAVLRAGPRELREHCMRSLQAMRVPPNFFIVPRIPRNPAGKLVRDELLAAYPEASARAWQG